MESEAIPAINVNGEPEVQLNPEPEVEVAADTSLPSETQEMIDGKFKSQDDLLAAYHELQSKLGGGPESTPAAPQEVPSEAPAGVPSDIVQEYASKIAESGGSITPEIYTELASKGYSKDFVDTYVQGVQAQEQRAFEGLVADVGGVTAYQSAVEWAVNNWSREQVMNYNNALNTADDNTAKIIINSLIQQSAVGGTPSGQPLHSNTTTGMPANTSGYATKSDYVLDAGLTNDRGQVLYEIDPGYRGKVEAKLALTNMSSWYSGLPSGM